MAKLGDPFGPGKLGTDLYAIAQDHRARYWVATRGTPGVNVYSAGGVFDRSVDPPLTVALAGDSAAWRRSAIGFIRAISSDTMLIVDDANHIASLYDVRGQRNGPVAQFAMPLQPGGTWFSLPSAHGSLIVSGEVPTREGIGYPLHVVGRDGVIHRSFGTDNPTATPESDPAVRILAAGDSGAFWAGHLGRYRIEQLDTMGAIRVRLDRRVPWFTPHVAFLPITPTQPPQPQLLDIKQDPAGRLWTLTRVADPQWRIAVHPAPSRNGRPRYRATDAQRLFDTLIEVIDPQCGRLLLSQRVSQSLDRFVASDRIAGWRMDDGAIPQLDVWRVELHVPPTEKLSCQGSNTTVSPSSP